MRIGEFSKLARVTIRLLRHYDEIDLLKPAKVDAVTGYRAYSIDQLPVLNKIMLLKELGMPLQDIKGHIDSGIDNEALRSMLKIKQQALEEQIEGAQMQMSMIDYRLEHLEDEAHTIHHITIKESEAAVLATLKRTVPHLKQMKKYCHDMYKELYETLIQHEIDYYGNEMTIYHTDGYYDLKNIPVEVGVQVRNLEANIQRVKASSLNVLALEQEKKMASLIHKGPFMAIEHSAVELIKWTVMNNYEMTGPLREWHLSGPAHTDGVVQEQPIIELQVPLKLEND